MSLSSSVGAFIEGHGMILSVSSPNFAPRTTAAAQPLTGLRSAQPSAPETSRASAGEKAAGNLRAETARAVEAAEQVAVSPRLRDQENAERTDRSLQNTDVPTGPPPAFRESLLERQARTAFEPPDAEAPMPEQDPEKDSATVDDTAAALPRSDFEQTPPGQTERAETRFAETRALVIRRDSGQLDVRT